MGVKLAEVDQMTIEEFLAFTAERPRGERWELIEGVPVMSPAPTNWHPIIAGNVYMTLGQAKIRTGAGWIPALGVGTRVPVSPRSLPQPDVMVFESLDLGAEPSSVTDDAFVLFEILSKSNSRGDQAWRRKVYASIANCRHYVTINSRKVAAVRYDYDLAWAQAAELETLGDVLEVPALGVRISLADIYRWTPLGN